ncbi:hypothetical protein TRIUR3_22327 [Triticum urartu]|uniref:Calcineurin-like phosphoesterase domain-containing protein n=1 Tax=Triticum urartu TaxID=4572 RepID=M7ZZ57_TRIUA|nr:hypothetical protein TRIUR3_22327 [Triticum urartu]
MTSVLLLLLLLLVVVLLLLLLLLVLAVDVAELAVHAAAEVHHLILGDEPERRGGRGRTCRDDVVRVGLSLMVITSSAPGIRLQGNIGKITSTALARQQNCKRLLPNRSISTDLLRICGSLLPLPLLLPPTLSSRARGNDAGEMAPSRTVICVGDVHGYISKLESLWANLQSALPADAFAAALVIFLGDYNDRGPDTRRVLDFLLALPARHPAQRHVFLCGNHDLAFAAFVGALPPPPDGSPFAATWDQYIDNEAHEGWFRGPGHEDMHVQGRRWGGVIKERWNPKKGLPYKGSIYDAQPTFESYGVAHGSPAHLKECLFLNGSKCSRMPPHFVGAVIGVTGDKLVYAYLNMRNAKEPWNALEAKFGATDVGNELRRVSSHLVSSSGAIGPWTPKFYLELGLFVGVSSVLRCISIDD